MRITLTLALWLSLLTATLAQPLGINLEGYDYPFPVRTLSLQPDGLTMAYMDVAPTKAANGKTAVLLHGKNFNGAYWEPTAKLLTDLGFRVVIPDQIGFGKSSKPVDYSYTFAQLITNTRTLLDQLEVEKATVVGHSMGGMLAAHWALIAPHDMEQLILVNPIGLEDWTAKGVPYRGIAGWLERELKTTEQSIENYQRTFYYDGEWNAEYARWAALLAAPINSPDYPRLAKVQALTAAMIVSQPVAHRFEQITVPTTLIIGERDRTALDKDLAAPEVGEALGRYDLLGKEVTARIPGSKLIALPGLGHLPQIEDFPRYRKALLEALGR